MEDGWPSSGSYWHVDVYEEGRDFRESTGKQSVLDETTPIKSSESFSGPNEGPQESGRVADGGLKDRSTLMNQMKGAW